MSESEKRSILIIDDDKTIRKLINHHLKLNNFTTFEAENSNQAFDILKNEKIDLVLSEVTMEGMDGFALQQKLNSNGFRIPIIFMSADKNIKLSEQYLKASGAVGFLQKPFNDRALFGLIKVAVEKKLEISIKHGNG